MLTAFQNASDALAGIGSDTCGLYAAEWASTKLWLVNAQPAVVLGHGGWSLTMGAMSPIMS